MKHLSEKNSELPFFSIFEAFRNSGYNMGIGEYEALLELLIGLPFYKPNDKIIGRDELFELCKILWLKPTDVPYSFEKIFNRGYQMLLSESLGEAQETDTEAQPGGYFSDFQRNNHKERLLNNNGAHQSISAAKIGDDTENNNDAKIFSIAINPQHVTEKKVLKENREPERRFLFTEHIYPITKRELYQALKSVVVKKSKKGYQNADVEATIYSIALNGLFKEIMFRDEPEIINSLIILHDQHGSMIAFEKLSQLFADTAYEIFKNIDKSNERVFNYYFQNVITNYIYLNRAKTKYQRFSELNRVFKNKKTLIIIISDCGAARRSRSEDRVQKTIGMLSVLKKITSKIVWLNPLPKDRWENTSAMRVSKFVPMFEMVHEDLINSVLFLRGKQLNVVP